MRQLIFTLITIASLASVASPQSVSCLDLSVQLQEKKASLEEMLGYQSEVKRSNHFVVESLQDQREKAAQTKELIDIFQREEQALTEKVADCESQE